LLDWTGVASEDTGNGITRQIIQGDRSTVVRYVYPAGSIFATHQHPEEQVTVVLRGRIAFSSALGDVTLGPGQSLIVPPNVAHGARVVGAESVETINVMAPRRDRSPSA
jgi:quercetin dioxygenase-like cupin family protein